MMKEFLLILICAHTLIWLVNCGTKRKNLSNNTSNNEKKFAPYRGGKNWTAENTPKKVSEYENAHYSDFLKNKDKYQVWPELSDEIPMMFCRKYIYKLFPFSVLRFQIIPEKWPLINLYYTATNGKISDPLEPVNVTAANCFVPNNSKSRYLLYIRAPRPQCVFLVKTMKYNAKPKFENDFRIINEFCVETDTNINKGLEINQEYKFYDGNERGKWIVRKPIVKSPDRIWKTEKRLEDVPPETLAKYEKEHLDNYLIQKDEYEIWPELKIMDKKSVCKKGIQYFFTQSIFKKVYPTLLWSMKLQYVNMGIEHNQDSPQTVNLPILQCYVPKCTRRRYHYYIRTPRPHCLYLVKPLTKSKWASFKIIDKFCDELESNNENFGLALLADVSALNRSPRRKRKWHYKCSIEELQNYEKAHYKEYNEDKDIYEKWEDLGALNKEMLCKKSIVPLFPSILRHDVYVSIITSAKLHYQYVTDCDGMTVTPNKVSVLQCYWIKSYRNKFFHFIKSTTASSCVLVVKYLAQNLLHSDFKIVNHLCLDSDEYQKLFLY